MKRKKFWWVLLWVLLLPLNALAGERIALVIGNQSYQFHTVLPEAAKDMKLMFDTLTSNGVDVINSGHLLDLDINYLNQWFDELERRAKTATEIYIYYAGHALQHNNAAYLLATDSPQYDGSTPTSSLLINTRLEKIAEANPTAKIIVWLDACRDNPLNYYNYVSPSYFGINLKSRKGLFIYSAAKGSKVSDNNPFTEKMTQLLKEFPHENIATLASEAATLTELKTKGKQIPEVDNSLGRAVCLAGCKTIAAKEFMVLPTGCIKDNICISTPLILSSTAINQADIREMLMSKPRTMDSDKHGGCWVYQDKQFMLNATLRWNLSDNYMASCLSKNDSEAYANWYTLMQADHSYELPTPEEFAYIAAFYRQEEEKERLQQCSKLGDDIPCYSHPQLGVHLVRRNYSR